MWSDFKAFLMRGNVLQLAVAFIMGSAFSLVVAGLVNDVIMPPIGLLLGRVNFTELFWNLSSTHYATLAKAQAAGAPVIAYGLFVNTVIVFIIVAFVVFLLVRQVQRMERPAPGTPPTTKTCSFCQMPIPIAATRCPNCTSELPATS
jgi:large conductance mechanosensitive channel